MSVKPFAQHIGVPVEKVGEKLLKLNEALKVQGMMLGADTSYNVSVSKHNNEVASVTLTVYLIGEENGDDGADGQSS
jgi:hypothetical protein